MTVAGKPVIQFEAVEKVTGRGIYTSDLTLPGMLHAAVLRSPHPHARIVAIDTSVAERMPGVHALVTGDETDRRYIHTGPRYADRYPLARGTVRFFGEEVAAVAAETLDEAEAAVRAIEVRYEPLSAAFDIGEACAEGAPVIHEREGLPANHAQRTTADWGGVEARTASAAHVVEGTFTNGIVAPLCLETNAVVASYRTDRPGIDIWAGTQAPFFARKEIAHVLDLPLDSVRIHPVLIGGGFGGKSQAPEPIAIAAFLSRKARRPVRIVLSRREEFVAGKVDHAKTMRVRTAADADGTIAARQTDFEVDNGAFTHMGIAYVSAVRQRTANLYRVASAGFDGRLVYTNKVPGGSYRGMGVPQIIWAIETQVDELAERLGRDPLDYRLQIANQPGDTTPQGFEITTCGLSECLRIVADRIGWADKKANRTPWRGVGIAAMINPSVGVLYPEGNFAKVGLELREDGVIVLATQAADCGTGQNTTLAQLAAEPLAVNLSGVAVVHMDTLLAPDDLGSAASRVTFVSGQAALDAGRRLRDEVAAGLALRWNVSQDAIVFADGRVGLRDEPASFVGWPDVAALIGSVRVEGHASIDLERVDPETGYGQYASTYGFGAQAAEVEVDPKTGNVRVLKIVSAIDIGRVINPVAMDGQMYGGIVQGIGMALREELVFSEGRPVNTTLMNYRVPRAVEMPEIESHYVETVDPSGPLGAKAGGEHSINPTVGAIANAIADATGLRFHDLPLTPHKVRAAIAKRESDAPPLESWRRPYNAEVAAVRSIYPSVVFPAMKALGKRYGRQPTPGSDIDYRIPSDLDAAVAELRRAGPRAKLMGGGTDLMPGIRQGVYSPDVLIDISGLAELRGIAVADDAVTIGAGSTLSEIIEHEGLRRALPMLCEGLERIATRQIRNVATLAGDLCQEKRCWFFRSGLPCYKKAGPSCPCYAVTGDNTHHAILGAKRCAAPCIADAAPILVALDAEIAVQGPAGCRTIAMEEFYRWAGETTLGPGEIIRQVRIRRPAGTTSAYEKFALWEGDFPEASAAVRVVRQAGAVTDVRISLGGVAPLPIRPRRAERLLIEKGLNDESIVVAARRCVSGALPMKDNAAKADMLIAVVERALQSAHANQKRSPSIQ